MTRSIFLTTLLLTGFLASGFYPVLLPQTMLDAVNTVALTLLAFDGILPMLAIFQVCAFLILIEVCIGTYKMFKWIIG